VSIWLWIAIATAHAIDLNDHVRLTLDGGEVVEGWFLRAGEAEVVLTRPSHNDVSNVAMGIIAEVQVNQRFLPLEEFEGEIAQAWAEWKAWSADPPPHPWPQLVGASSLLLAGSGHGILGRWDLGGSMMVVDAASMGVIAVEASGRGTGRLDVVLTAAVLSVLFKSYAASDAARLARRRRKRLGLSH
jgi:hypothetical protein